MTAPGLGNRKGRSRPLRRLGTVNVFGLSLLPASARKKAAIVRACRKTLASEKAAGKGELNVIFLDRAKMRRLNKEYLEHSHDTDVIAFNYDAEGPASADQPFGDVYVSAFQARRQAKAMGHPVLTEVLTLVIHGTLHLLGYDDATPRQKARMFRRQDAILSPEPAALSRAGSLALKHPDPERLR